LLKIIIVSRLTLWCLLMHNLLALAAHQHRLMSKVNITSPQSTGMPLVIQGQSDHHRLGFSLLVARSISTRHPTAIQEMHDKRPSGVTAWHLRTILQQWSRAIVHSQLTRRGRTTRLCHHRYYICAATQMHRRSVKYIYGASGLHPCHSNQRGPGDQVREWASWLPPQQLQSLSARRSSAPS